MKLTRDHATKQAGRLFANPVLMPQTKQGMTELIDCLMRNCQGPDHCAATMTAVLDGSMEFPRDVETTTARITYAARRLQVPEMAPAGCDRCYLGPDVTTGEIRWYAHVPTDRGGISFAGRCECSRGRWLAARDQERLREQERDAEPVKPRHEHPADVDWKMRAGRDD